jgi:hypothetical protein
MHPGQKGLIGYRFLGFFCLTCFRRGPTHAAVGGVLGEWGPPHLSNEAEARVFSQWHHNLKFLT